MTDVPVLRDLGVVLIAAAAFLFATRPLKLPPILAYMMAGLAVGPLTGLLAVSESIELFSHLGVALLLFVVGMELSLEKIRDVGGRALRTGTVQVLVMAALGAGVALALGFDGTEAVFLGLAVTFSSTVVVIKLLDRAGDLDAVHGRIAIGILLVQDVLVAVVLTLVGGLGGTAGGGGSIWTGLASAFLGILVLALVAAAAVRWVLGPVFRWLAESGEALFISALTWAFAFILAAEAIHVSIELGAFIAGVAMAQLPYNDELRRRVHPLVDFFLAVFFVSLGAGMELVGVGDLLLPALALSALALLVKPVVVAVLLTRFGGARRTGFLAGLTLGQISEFAFILLALGVSGGLVGEEILSLVGLMGLITIGASALLVPRGARLYRALEDRGLLEFLGGGDEVLVPPEPRSGHVVIVGMNTLGRMLVERFRETGEQVLAVDTDPDKLLGLGVDTLFGSVDSPTVLDEAGVERAKLVVSALQIEDANSMLAYRCARMGVPVSIHAFDASLAHELFEIGADHLMISKLDGIRQMEQAIHQHARAG